MDNKISLGKVAKEKPMAELLSFSIINLDKPIGPTCFTVDTHIKDLLNLTKISHFGTLDPTTVSGVLPIALNRACRLNDFFMHKNKTYVGILHLHKDISEEELKKEMKKFLGKITQTPPVRSNVARKPRKREVFSFDLIEKDGREVLFKAEVEAGTYIRTLATELGKNIGEAHMLELRRTQAGIFSETDKNFVTMYQLESAVNEYKNGNEKPLREILIPAETAIKQVLPVVQVSPKDIKQILTGKPIIRSDLKEKLPDSEYFSLFLKDKFIAIVRVVDEGDIIARPVFVLN